MSNIDKTKQPIETAPDARAQSEEYAGYDEYDDSAQDNFSHGSNIQNANGVKDNGTSMKDAYHSASTRADHLYDTSVNGAVHSTPTTYKEKATVSATFTHNDYSAAYGSESNSVSNSTNPFSIATPSASTAAAGDHGDKARADAAEAERKRKIDEQLDYKLGVNNKKINADELLQSLGRQRVLTQQADKTEVASGYKYIKERTKAPIKIINNMIHKVGNLATYSELTSAGLIDVMATSEEKDSFRQEMKRQWGVNGSGDKAGFDALADGAFIYNADMDSKLDKYKDWNGQVLNHDQVWKLIKDNDSQALNRLQSADGSSKTAKLNFLTGYEKLQEKNRLDGKLAGEQSKALEKRLDRICQDDDTCKVVINAKNQITNAKEILKLLDKLRGAGEGLKVRNNEIKRLNSLYDANHNKLYDSKTIKKMANEKGLSHFNNRKTLQEKTREKMLKNPISKPFVEVKTKWRDMKLKGIKKIVGDGGLKDIAKVAQKFEKLKAAASKLLLVLLKLLGILVIILLGVSAAATVIVVIVCCFCSEGNDNMKTVCEEVGASETSSGDEMEHQFLDEIETLRTSTVNQVLGDNSIIWGGSDVGARDTAQKDLLRNGDFSWGCPSRIYTSPTNSGDGDESEADSSSTADGTYVSFYNGKYKKRDPNMDYFEKVYEAQSGIADNDRSTVEGNIANFYHNHMDDAGSYDYYDSAHQITYYSTLKEILCCTNVALNNEWDNDSVPENDVKEYAKGLWEQSHDLYVTTSALYMCNKSDFSNTDVETNSKYHSSSHAGDDTILGYGCELTQFTQDEFTGSSEGEVQEKINKLLEYKVPNSHKGEDSLRAPGSETYEGCYELYTLLGGADGHIGLAPDGLYHAGWNQIQESVTDSDGNVTNYLYYDFDGRNVNVAYCPGHMNLNLNVMIAGVNENNDLTNEDTNTITENMLTGTIMDDTYQPAAITADGDVFEGWKTNECENAQRMVVYYNNNSVEQWKSNYGLDIKKYMKDGIYHVSKVEEEDIAATSAQSMKELHITPGSFASEILQVASSAVGKIPYYWGGAASAPGLTANGFGNECKAYRDSNGAWHHRKGLDCSGYVSWVYNTVKANDTSFHPGFPFATHTASLPPTGTFNPSSTHYPFTSGDIIFVKKTADKFGHAMIVDKIDSNGKVWVYEEGGAGAKDADGVSNVGHNAKNLAHCYGGRTMYYIHIH